MRLGYVQYIQDIQPNVPACTTFIDIYNHEQTEPTIAKGTWTYLDVPRSVQRYVGTLSIYANVPRYLLALHVHGPHFTTP